MFNLRGMVIVAISSIATSVFAAPVCSTISDSTSGKIEATLDQFFYTFINGNELWDQHAHNAITTHEDFVEYGFNEFSKTIVQTDPESPEFFRRQFYSRRYDASDGSGLGYFQRLQVHVCANAEQLFYHGAINSLARERIGYGNMIGGEGKNKGSWGFMVDFQYWGGSIGKCQQSFYKGELPALLDCYKEYYLPKKSTLNPEESKRVQELHQKMERVKEDAYRINHELRVEAEELSKLIESIRNKPLAQLTREDFRTADDLWNLVEALRKKVDKLALERDLLKLEFDTSWQAANTDVDEVIERFDLNVSDFATSFAFNIQDSMIKLEELAADPAFSTRVYQQYADETLKRLRQLNSVDDSIGFVTEAKLWLDTAANLQNILDNKDISTVEEWSALTASLKRVNDYIFTVVDRDFWFRDSALTLEQRQSLEILRVLDRVFVSNMERDLRDYRTHNMTLEKQEALILLEAMGNGLAGVDPKDADRYTPILRDLAIVIKDGAVCVTKVVVAGDLADLYEVIIGKDFCSGEQLSTSERVVTSVGLVIGSGHFWRQIVNTTTLTGTSKHVVNLAATTRQKAEDMGMTDSQLLELKESLKRVNSCG